MHKTYQGGRWMNIKFQLQLRCRELASGLVVLCLRKRSAMVLSSSFAAVEQTNTSRWYLENQRLLPVNWVEEIRLRTRLWWPLTCLRYSICTSNEFLYACCSSQYGCHYFQYKFQTQVNLSYLTSGLYIVWSIHIYQKTCLFNLVVLHFRMF